MSDFDAMQLSRRDVDRFVEEARQLLASLLVQDRADEGSKTSMMTESQSQKELDHHQYQQQQQQQQQQQPAEKYPLQQQLRQLQQQLLHRAQFNQTASRLLRALTARFASTLRAIASRQQHRSCAPPTAHVVTRITFDDYEALLAGGGACLDLLSSDDATPEYTDPFLIFVSFFFCLSV